MSLDAAAVIGSLQQTQFLDIDTTYFDYLICLNTHIKQLFYEVLTTDYLKESTAAFLYHGNFPYKIEICEKKKKATLRRHLASNVHRHCRSLFSPPFLKRLQHGL